MKIIGHRGAAGLALENTLASFEIATLLGLDAIELDVRITKDGTLVVVHDSDLKRVSNSSESIKNLTITELQAITLSDGRSNVPTLDQVIELTGKIPLIVEIKSEGCLERLIEVIKKNPRRNITIVSFKHNELAKLRDLDQKVNMYGLERTKPIDIIQLARSIKLDGIGLNYWLLNPLTYWAARRYGLELYVYTVNSRFIGKIIELLYPKVGICSDYPERFLKHAYPLSTVEKKRNSGQ